MEITPLSDSHSEAEEAYRRAIKLKPDYAEAHLRLGVTLQELRRPAEAEAASRRAIDLKPDDAVAHYHQAECCGAGHRGGAIRHAAEQQRHDQ
jgi:tetratricopeptide (TPR) repeat protein